MSEGVRFVVHYGCGGVRVCYKYFDTFEEARAWALKHIDPAWWTIARDYSRQS